MTKLQTKRQMKHCGNFQYRNLCGKIINSERETTFMKGKICQKCGNEFIESTFAPSSPFNKWLDSFIQSRIELYIPEYKEYYRIYKLKKCPECNGRGMVAGHICSTYGFSGVVKQ